MLFSKKHLIFAFIALFFFSGFASAHPTVDALDTALTNSADKKSVKKAIEELMKLGESQVTDLLLEAYPADTFMDYSHPQSIFLVNALSSHGKPEATGFVLETLNALKGSNSPLKPLLIYCLMKAGLKNKDRVGNFLSDYKLEDTDPDTLHAIGVMMEFLDANLSYAENGNPNDVDVDERVAELAKMIQRPWYQCSKKLWSFNPNPQAIFIDSKTQQAWNLTQSGLQELESIPSHLTYDFKFTFSNYNNAPAIAVDLRKTFGSDPHYKGNYGLYLALHEGFHQMYQSRQRFVADKGFQSGSHYPPKVEPRYYRRMMYDYLKSALKGSVDRFTALSKAKYWYNKWRTEFPGELSQNVDRHEGTAMYYDVLAVAIGHKGCSASKSQIISFINKNYDKFFQTPNDFRDEGYNIGALSSLQLWIDGDNWVNTVAQGKSPLEILFSKYAAISDSDNSMIRQEVSAKEAKEALENEKNLHGDVDNFKSQDYVRIAIPNSWNNERLPLLSMVLPQSMPNDSIFITTEGYYSYSYENKQEFIKALGPLPLFKIKSSPCDKSYGYILMSKSDLSIYTNSQVSGANQYAEIAAQGSKVTDKRGLEWFCSK
ncbi:MAG: hypothetical protein H6625_10635 [Bdellovibrionaceae bacterium]|nr:hypothetical protein [Pseudobdellovibrionaceae bacterium]